MEDLGSRSPSTIETSWNTFNLSYFTEWLLWGQKISQVSPHELLVNYHHLCRAKSNREGELIDNLLFQVPGQTNPSALTQLSI